MDNVVERSREELLNELDRRVEDGIIEKSNADLLKKLIKNAETLTEAIAIAELGTTYKRTGFHFDKRLEKTEPAIKYFKKNDDLSFSDGTDSTPNKLIIGDNYDALLNLLVEYRGQIDVIYIDPPYGKDNMGEFAQTEYDNAITRDNLLSMLYPRLVLARQLLTPTGVLFCSIDERNQEYFKCLLNEIFYEKNTDTLIWQKTDSQVDRNTNAKIIHRFKSIHESIIIAYGNKSQTYFNKTMRLPEWKNEQSNPDNDPRGPWSSGIISYEEGHKNEDKSSEYYYAITTPGGQVYTRHWFVLKEEFERLNADNRIHYPKNGNGVPRLKTFENEEKEYYLDSILRGVGTSSTAKDELESLFNNRDIFDTPKPTKLIKELIRVASKKESIILDFFAGSGTTGESVLSLNREDDGNRHFIVCTNNEITKEAPNGIAYDVTTKRLKRTMTGSCYDDSTDFKWIKDNEPLGGSLDVYEIAEVANFESVPGQTAFDVIDETLYGQERFSTLKEKIEWVCRNFEGTQKVLESDADWKKRLEEDK